VAFLFKNENTGIRFNLDLPSMGNQLSATINIKGVMKTLEYKLISLPLYFAGNLSSRQISEFDIQTSTV